MNISKRKDYIRDMPSPNFNQVIRLTINNWDPVFKELAEIVKDQSGMTKSDYSKLSLEDIQQKLWKLHGTFSLQLLTLMDMNRNLQELIKFQNEFIATIITHHYKDDNESLNSFVLELEQLINKYNYHGKSIQSFVENNMGMEFSVYQGKEELDVNNQK